MIYAILLWGTEAGKPFAFIKKVSEDKSELQWMWQHLIEDYNGHITRDGSFYAYSKRGNIKIHGDIIELKV